MNVKNCKIHGEGQRTYFRALCSSERQFIISSFSSSSISLLEKFIHRCFVEVWFCVFYFFSLISLCAMEEFLVLFQHIGELVDFLMVFFLKEYIELKGCWFTLWDVIPFYVGAAFVLRVQEKPVLMGNNLLMLVSSWFPYFVVLEFNQF